MAKSGRNPGKRSQANAQVMGRGESPDAPKPRTFTRNLIQSVTLLALGGAAACVAMSASQPVAGRSVESGIIPAAAQPISHDNEARTVWQLLALPDAELERVDVVELNLAVVCEIPGHEDLDIAKYQRTVDAWAEAIRQELSVGEMVFQQSPEKWQHDVRFFRLGVMSGYLDQTVGIAYIDEQKQAQIEARKQGRDPEIVYTDPGQLFLHGLIDTKRGTCGNMPTLHVALGRRLSWPVSLSPVASHTVCRFDDGEVVYNIETTHTEQGGMFSAGTDEDYIKEFKLPRRAIANGSDLHTMTARQMLGYFISLRGRYYADTGQLGLADRDFALARSLLPNHRELMINSMAAAVHRSNQLFGPEERGHPISLARWLNGPAAATRQAQQASKRAQMDAHMAEIERINAMNRANQQRLMHMANPAGHAVHDPHAGWPQPGVPAHPGFPYPPNHPQHQPGH